MIISIIVATYNSEKTIRRTLLSIKEQAFLDWECLIIDGASNDGTISIVKEFLDEDNRFRYISEPDNGIYDAFNKGWRNAKGEWVYYLGSDDIVLPDGFNQLVPHCSSDYAIVSGNVITKRIDGTQGLWPSRGFMGCHQGKLTRRAVLEDLNGYNLSYKILADLEFHTRLKNLGYNAFNVQSNVAVFDLGGASQSNRYLFIRFKERVRIYRNDRYSKYPIVKALYFSCRELLKNLYMNVRKLQK